MNPIIEVLKNQTSTNEIKYRNTDAPTGNSILVVYFSSYRLKITSSSFMLYEANVHSGFYEAFYDKEDGLDNDEYFNLSVQYGLNDICLKDNIDIIRQTLHNLNQGLHIIDMRRD